MNRNLDSIYFRVQRDGEWQNVCFTDLTEEEIKKVTACWPPEGWKVVAIHLKGVVNEIGDEFNIVRRDKNEKDNIRRRPC